MVGGNHIVICKKILEIVFKEDPMEDYMNYSSASEDDIDYEDCEEDEWILSESASTEGSPSKQRVINVESDNPYSDNPFFL